MKKKKSRLDLPVISPVLMIISNHGEQKLKKKKKEYSPAPQFKGINSLALSLLYGPTLTSIRDYWKNHCFDYTDLCQQSDVF